MNRHDQWVQFRDAHRAEFEQTGLPEAIWSREVRLARFLAAGECEGADSHIRLLTDDQFLQLESLVKQFYPDLQDFAGFTALLNERLHRFGRYG